MTIFFFTEIIGRLMIHVRWWHSIEWFECVTVWANERTIFNLNRISFRHLRYLNDAREALFRFHITNQLCLYSSTAIFLISSGVECPLKSNYFISYDFHRWVHVLDWWITMKIEIATVRLHFKYTTKSGWKSDILNRYREARRVKCNSVIWKIESFSCSEEKSSWRKKH